MRAVAHGLIVVWQGGSLWLFDVPAAPDAPERTDFHAHHALQVTLALDGVFTLHTRERAVAGPAALVGADVRHAFQPRGVIALLFAEPESPAGRGLAARWLDGQPVAALPPEPLEAARAEALAAFRRADRPALAEIGRRMTQALAGGADPFAPDPRVEHAIAWAAGRLDERLTIADAARRAGLSVDRMSHLFVEQTGLAFRTYVLWLRMARAVEGMAAGASLTEAAHAAGFADSAHFSRTFRRMFGVAAASLRLA